MPLVVGDRLGSYEIRSPLGAGGMGEVYRARHVRLGRDVAIKVLPAKYVNDHERLRRFEREARSASALNHPNIVTIYDVDEHEGTPYLAMELIEGRTFREVMAEGPLPIERVIALMGQVVDGLAKAHAAGIIHRDLKPDNVMVTGDGLVKILDFGLAKLAHDAPVDSDISTVSVITRKGDLGGTLQYLAPEQIAGRPADHRSDQFAFGVMLYELLCGRRPFHGDSTAAVLGSILESEPPPVRTVRPDTPEALEAIVERCLQKDPDRRYSSIADVGEALIRCQRRFETDGQVDGLLLGRPTIVALAVAIVALVGAASWWWIKDAGVRWARVEALPEITRLTEQGRIYDAYRLTLEAQRHIPGDAELLDMLDRITLPMSVATDPAGALVEVRGYGTTDESWHELGLTPLELRVPYALMRWRISKAGFETFEGAPFGGGTMRLLGSGLPLQPEGTQPPDMVQVPDGLDPSRGYLPIVELHGAYWLDRYEVTNRQFQEFVDQGGYGTPEYWPEPFVEGAEEISWDEAMSRLVDTTGRPGPATWELGAHAAGRDDYPVGGLSWYEAAAYCAFAGKRLPTAYHWYNATHQDQLSDIVRLSNFGPDGPAPVGRYAGMGDFGTYDMAGNVKEWVWNATGDKRFILGGGWGEPTYQFGQPDARRPLERLPTHGVRCARYVEPLEPALLEPITLESGARERVPVSDEVFEAYRGLYTYAHTPLDAAIEAVDDRSPYWRKETVSFAAAYGGERVTALLFLPKDAAPPYQTVLWFPGDDVFASSSSDKLASAYMFDFVPRGGRALVYPIYKGMYERRVPFSHTPVELRDMMLFWYRDLARTLDYLETRDDIDSGRVAFYGFSTAFYGTIFSAVDPRLAASVLLSTGALPAEEVLPEMDPVNFAPHSRIPTLMINGRDDFIFPVESSQVPLFRLLGAPESDKRHALLEGGHLPPDRRAIIREVLGWLDRYLGPVTPASGSREGSGPPLHRTLNGTRRVAAASLLPAMAIVSR